jgi:hypothetical protein
MCTNDGSVTGSGHHVGGIAGYIKTADGCYNHTQVEARGMDSEGKAYVGGVAGEVVVPANLNNDGKVVSNSKGDYVGGCAGFAYISQSTALFTNTGDVESKGSYVAGIFGYAFRDAQLSDGVISVATNTGNVISSGDYVAGLVGYAEAKYRSSIYGKVHIEDSSSSGNVTGEGYVGGCIGYGEFSNINGVKISGTITGKTNTFAIGTTTGEEYDNDTTEAEVIII